MSNCLKMREKQLHNDHLSFFLSGGGDQGGIRGMKNWRQRNVEKAL